MVLLVRDYVHLAPRYIIDGISTMYGECDESDGNNTIVTTEYYNNCCPTSY